MSRWNRSDMHNLSGRTVVVTGASSGLGLRTATELAAAGVRVVLAVRSLAKGREAAESIAGRTDVRELDVADLNSVNRFASEWTGDIDVLVNNAGIMEVPFAVTADGYESQAATNYLGPFALTNLLLPHITDRVVFVGSQLHRMGKIHLDDLAGTARPYKKSDAYRDSKLAITLLGLELQRRLDLAHSPVRAIVAHPGIASTNLSRHAMSGKITHALRFLFNDIPTASLSLLYAATEDVPGNSYVGPRGPGGLKGHPVLGQPAAAGRDGNLAEVLWSATERLLGITFSPLPSGELA
ncbi:NADP-dependent 3-hydroxy acid dehydrogenase YdfG [Nakamurella panacisegetis]|uniref:NADP-dependent 3-hydroxy acid dehydrogenase YdfG n=1 Tax=Nakamurella panacisegetis TaxID=1090615 RepID=A0A1H0R7T4_9ACTN|nr:SDR family NAD(P)-dependent oxidoreductase [Nakamurella panacisegetis]SDP25557.1 NADP-dependent 3-hydroxy acid dehydrogenase YdfG [Nakamurella panacisegetis]